MPPTPRTEETYPGSFKYHTPAAVSGIQFLREWKTLNPGEYNLAADHQAEQARLEDEEYRAREEINEPSERDIQEGTPEYDLVAAHQAEQTQLEVENQRTDGAIQQSANDMFESASTSHGKTRKSSASSKSLKKWFDMSRVERKDILNTATTQVLRNMKRRLKRHIQPHEKKAVKERIQRALRNELIGDEIYTDENSRRLIVMDEGNRRRSAGLSRMTHEEKEAFVQQIAENAAQGTEAAVQKIIESELAALPPKKSAANIATELASPA
jgi:hypothetical protein